MSHFMSDSYLLKGKSSHKLYSFVKDLPIFDYHCHLSPSEIFQDRKFYNLTELWLEADHYKWRLMRNFGIDESLITGDSAPYDKFYAFCTAIPAFIGNPVYHWAHLELKIYFDLTIPICQDNAKLIWDTALQKMSDGSFSARQLIKISNVDTVITTDDPIDDLNFHKLLKKENLPYNVLPCFRPDKVINIEKYEFSLYIKNLANKAEINITSIDDLEKAIENRIIYFANAGATAADLSFTDFPYEVNREKAEKAFLKKLNKENITLDEENAYKFEIIYILAKLFSKHNFVMQIHTGVVRNQNTARYNLLGQDCGIDSVANAPDIINAGRLFDKIELNGGLPKTIIYTLNPTAYYPIATMLGDFAGGVKGKMQLGAAWWFADHRDGIKEQLKVFASIGGLGLFNGMLTDSRSFVSYARHDYFRRILCSIIGKWVDDGEYPDDDKQLKELLTNICYNNSKTFFSSRRKI
jgi:glucuronate isomerase